MDNNRFDKLIDDTTRVVINEIPGDIIGDLSQQDMEALQIKVGSALIEALKSLKDLHTYF